MLKHITGALAVGTALAGAVVVLSGASASTAGATTVMGGVPAPAPVARHYYRPVNRNINRQAQNHRAMNRNKNKNKEWQHSRQHQGQDQFLMRDFTLVLTPFQKTESGSGAAPYNWQWSNADTRAHNDQTDLTNAKNDPQQKQDATNDPNLKQVIVVTPTPTAT